MRDAGIEPRIDIRVDGTISIRPAVAVASNSDENENDNPWDEALATMGRAS